MADTKDLKIWRNSRRTQVKSSRDPVINRLLEASENGEFVEIVYFGGSTPGATRSVMPIRLFTAQGYDDSMYVEAFCELREDNRVFRLDRLELVSEGLSPISSTSTKSPRPKTKRRQTTIRKKASAPSQPQQATTNNSYTHQRSATLPSIESTSGRPSYGWLVWLAIGLLVFFAFF